MSAEPALSDSERALLSQRADAFYAALTRSQAPEDWEPFLDGVPVSLRPVFLGELVIIDIARRWQRGERPLLEQYVERFPDLGPMDRVSPKLIAEEYRARLKAGEARDADQYRRRFPAQFRELEDELYRIEQESSIRGRSGAHRASVTLAPGEASAARPPASGTVGESASVRPSAVIGSVTRSRSAEYTRVKRLGAGQFGEVWLVETLTGIRKALKVMHRPAEDEAGKRELRSLDLIKNEQHPYLLRTEDYWIEENKLYVLMEVADCTLRNWLAEFNPGKEAREYTQGLPPAELLHVMREAAEVLDHLHEKQVMHRDIKPDNILLLNRHAKVADFGLARHQDPAIATQSVMAGSPAYMAPEVWSGRYGAASDLYSLAVTYAELRQARLPVKLGPMAEIMFAHLEGQFEFRTDVFTKPELEVVRKAMSKEPGQRYATCSEFVAELVKAVGIPLSLPLYQKLGGTKTELPPLPPMAPPTASPTLSPSVLDTKGPSQQTKDWGPPKSPSGRETLPFRTKAKARPKANLIGVGVAVTVILALLGLIAYIVFVGFTGTPTSGGTEPTTGGSTGGGVGPVPTTKPIEPTPPTTKPVEPKPFWKPEETERAGGADLIPISGGRQVPLWVQQTVNGQMLKFRFIPAGAPDGTRPFYISERKVSNQMFGKPGPGGENAPATGMTAAEARDYIGRHFGKANGRLPSPLEWDHAAGRHDSTRTQGTVTKAGGIPRVNRKLPTDPEAGGTPDLNYYDLLDMAGNGREWTCGVLTLGDKPKVEAKPSGAFNATDFLVLRGRNYTLKEGLTFDHLDREAGVPERQLVGDPQRQLAGEPSPYTGFRVVLPIPEK